MAEGGGVDQKVEGLCVRYRNSGKGDVGAHLKVGIVSRM